LLGTKCYDEGEISLRTWSFFADYAEIKTVPEFWHREHRDEGEYDAVGTKMMGSSRGKE
jgi:hypothetical protein